MIKHFLWIIFVLSTVPFYAQDPPNIVHDTISQLSFDEIRKKYDLESDKNLYALAYIKKSKEIHDTIKLAEGYDLMASVGSRDQAIIYNDSIIQISDKLINTEYAAKSYIRKARLLGSDSKFSKAMKTLVKADKYASITNNIKQHLQISYMIGLLKIQLGEYSEGVQAFKEIDLYYDNIENQNTYVPFEHINAIFGMAYGYNCLKEYNSAQKANQKAIHLTLKHKDSSFYEELLVSSAMTSYYRKEYKASIDSIKKYKKIKDPKRNSFTADIMSELFLGHIEYDHSRIDNAENHYKNVDSLVFKNAYFHPEIRSAYEQLIKIQKKKGKLEDQLFYLNKLIKVDSILDKNYKNVLAILNKEYITPQLLKEKEKLITQLQEKNTLSNTWVVVSSTMGIATLFLLLIYYKRNKTYKQRFQELMQQTSVEAKSIKNSKEQVLDISETVVSDILEKLQKFEAAQGFLAPNLTAVKMASKLNTNSKYLTKTIKHHKDKSFIRYINDLRIEYIIEQLKNDRKLQNYTLKALALESGFNSPDVFTKYFSKKTGISPSYFVKQLRSIS